MLLCVVDCRTAADTQSLSPRSWAAVVLSLHISSASAGTLLDSACTTQSALPACQCGASLLLLVPCQHAPLNPCEILPASFCTSADSMLHRSCPRASTPGAGGARPSALMRTACRIGHGRARPHLVQGAVEVAPRGAAAGRLALRMVAVVPVVVVPCSTQPLSDMYCRMRCTPPLPVGLLISGCGTVTRQAECLLPLMLSYTCPHQISDCPKQHYACS